MLQLHAALHHPHAAPQQASEELAAMSEGRLDRPAQMVKNESK